MRCRNTYPPTGTARSCAPSLMARYFDDADDSISAISSASSNFACRDSIMLMNLSSVLVATVLRRCHRLTSPGDQTWIPDRSRATTPARLRAPNTRFRAHCAEGMMSLSCQLEDSGYAQPDCTLLFPFRWRVPARSPDVPSHEVPTRWMMSGMQPMLGADHGPWWPCLRSLSVPGQKHKKRFISTMAPPRRDLTCRAFPL